ncbi:hypothetical protein AB5J62_39220 [Amycolatopsis sp. cg5]|uniref:hypothetical protein n=1 Tax=Amycolatopsis sp. cg5 TaxID=3238802 RepID=UPI00352339BA
MVEVRTFLRMPDGSFEPFSECVTSPRDPDYVEGAIELVVEGVEIFGLPEWDLVDQLWAYICEMLARFRAENQVQISFPDSPIDFILKRSSPGRVLVTAQMTQEKRSVSVSEEELVTALTVEARRVLTRMSELLPGSKGSYAIALDQLAD